jgi:hypothetical protein
LKSLRLIWGKTSNWRPKALICLTSSTTVEREVLSRTVSMLKIFAGFEAKASHVLERTSEPNWCSLSNLKGAS